LDRRFGDHGDHGTLGALGLELSGIGGRRERRWREKKGHEEKSNNPNLLGGELMFCICCVCTIVV
jgi:hypothetical protein